ncbi:peptide chain release factor-like protein [Candidatus Vidania fulgoroideorum]
MEDLRSLLNILPNEYKKDCYIEIIASVGGKDACYYTSFLYGMFARIIQYIGYRFSIIDSKRNSMGQLSYITIHIHGPCALGIFKQDEGHNKFINVSNTKSNGRIQTSTCIVNVYEATKKESVSLSNKDIRTDTFRSSGAGGQHVNKTNSAIRLTHLPTGISCTCQAERSQAQNKRTAMRMLSAKLSHYLSEETQRVKNHTRQTKIYHAQNGTFYFHGKRLRTKKDILFVLSFKIRALINRSIV